MHINLQAYGRREFPKAQENRRESGALASSRNRSVDFRQTAHDSDDRPSLASTQCDSRLMLAPRVSGSRGWDDWAAALPQHKCRGRELIGPCPACGGTDRFHVTRKRGSGVLVGCRGCIDGQSAPVRREQFLKIIQTVFGNVPPARSAQPFTPLKPLPKSNSNLLPVAELLWAAGLPSRATPVRDYLARRWIWPNIDAAVPLPEGSLRWLPAVILRRLLPRKRLKDGTRPCPLPASAAGGLAFAFRTEEGRLSAVSLEGLTTSGGFPPEGRFRRTYGSRKGAFFTPQRSEGRLVVCEGELDALAGVALGRTGDVQFAGAEMRAYGGTANLAEAVLPTKRGSVLIVSDGDPAGWRSALTLRQRCQDAQILWLSGKADLASLLAETIEERIAVYELEAGLPSDEAEQQAWAAAGLLELAKAPFPPGMPAGAA